METEAPILPESVDEAVNTVIPMMSSKETLTPIPILMVVSLSSFNIPF